MTNNEMINRLVMLGIKLNQACSTSQIAALEKTLGCIVPDEVKALYLHHDGMDAYYRPFPVRLMPVEEVIEAHPLLIDSEMLIDSVRAFWADDVVGDYVGIYVSGPLKGKICHLSHDEIDYAPVYRTVQSFYDAGFVAAEMDTDWSEMKKDYPVLQPDLEEAEDLPIALQLLAEFERETDWKKREHLAFSAMNLLPLSQRHWLFEFAQSENRWIQARACEVLGNKKIAEAIPWLAALARNGSHNVRIASMVALRNFDTPEAEQERAALLRELDPSWVIYL